MTVATRYLGTCPVCYREQKLHKMVMVHHGFRKPGYGYIVGDCFGVGWTPFELSPDGTIAYVERVLQPHLERSETFLQRLKDGSVTELSVPDYSKPPSRFGRETKKITPADGHVFKIEVGNQIRSTENTIRQLTRDIAERTELVAKWQKRPVVTEDEVVQKRARVTEERRALLDEARAAKRAKREALDAKQRAREQEKLDLIAEYRNIFEQLARRASDSDRSEAKRHWIYMWKRMNRKSYLSFYPKSLEADEALQRLGLAVPSSHRDGYMVYANDLGWDPRP